MDTPLFVGGIALAAVGAVLLATIYFYPGKTRRENRRRRSLTARAREAGLRGRYRFEEDASKWGSIGGFGTYEPVDPEDRGLFSVVGSKIEGEAALFSTEMLWTDARVAWLGVPALLIGGAAAVASAFG